MSAIDSDPVQLGERLRIARTAIGITQDAAAKTLGMARTTLLAIEAGGRKVRAEELVALCKLYGVSMNAILHRQAAVDIVPRFRRAAPGTMEKDEAATNTTTQTLQQLAAGYVSLEQSLGRSLRLEYPPTRPITKGRLGEQAEEVAAELRSFLGVGLRPIENVVWLAETELGIRVFERSLPSGIAGAFAFDDVAGACVVLNLKHPRPRRAMTLAHELGHFMTDRRTGEVLREEPADGDPGERFATLFAPALLMPAAAVRRRFEEACEAEGKFNTRTLVFLARTFYVSVEAMCRRLEYLELLDRGTYEMLRARGLTESAIAVAMGPTPAETMDIHAPRRLGMLVAEAHEKGMLSEGQAAQALGVDRLTAREYLDVLGGAPEGPARGADV